MNEAYAARMRGCSNEVVYRLRGFDGVTRWVADRGDADRQADGRVIVDGIVSNITARKVAEERLNGALRALEEARGDAELRARTDYLTGAHNRAHFAEALAAELDRAGRESRKTGLALIDVDHFKLVNDRYGHLTGDAVLVEVARRLRAILREYDTLARWGGEEFAILAPGIESPGQRRILRNGSGHACRTSRSRSLPRRSTSPRRSEPSSPAARRHPTTWCAPPTPCSTAPRSSGATGSSSKPASPTRPERTGRNAQTDWPGARSAACSSTSTGPERSAMASAAPAPGRRRRPARR